MNLENLKGLTDQELEDILEAGKRENKGRAMAKVIANFPDRIARMCSTISICSLEPEIKKTIVAEVQKLVKALA